MVRSGHAWAMVQGCICGFPQLPTTILDHETWNSRARGGSSLKFKSLAGNMAVGVLWGPPEV